MKYGLANEEIARKQYEREYSTEVSDRGLPCHDQPNTIKDPPCRQRCTQICRELKRPPVGVVWELGEGGASSGTSLDHGSKLRGPSPKALVAEQCDVNIQSFNQSILHSGSSAGTPEFKPTIDHEVNHELCLL
ncbi:hypothetical protein TNCV_2075211 [Trichonephila clavipes]|nr:hypothetical protein TNCV_2075211 [Trichonephila clavipes]